MKNQSDENIETKIQEYLKALRNNIGKRVKIEHVWYGVPQEEESTLRNVKDYVNIEIEGAGIPFIGYGSAIRRILGENDEVLYENPLIPHNYDLRRDEDMDQLRTLSFGHDIADKLKQQRIKERMEWEEKVRRLDEEARNNLEKYLMESSPLVRDDKLEEWREYVRKNTQDFYSAGVVDASIRVMKALSEGKTPKEAEKEIYEMGITGFQAGCMAQTMAYFHLRGEEFREYWNRQFLPEEEADKSKGVVNPAIWTIEVKE